MSRNSSMRKVFLLLLAYSFMVFPFKDHAISEDGGHAVSPEVNGRGMAINPQTDTAVIVIEEEKDDRGPKTGYVAVIDLNTSMVIAKIPVGRDPEGVAIDQVLNLALVCNKDDKSVSVVDLNSLSLLDTIFLGREPGSIAIDPLTHKALVTVHDSDKGMLIDLTTHKVTGTVTTGEEPIDVAIDPQLSLGLIVSEEDHSVSVLDLDSLNFVRTVKTGKNPLALDINPETHIAAAVNEKDNSLTVIDLLTWQTATISVGKHPTNAAINQLDNRALLISDKDRSLLLVDLDMKTIIKRYSLNKKPGGVAVNCLTNTAVVMEGKTGALTLIQLPNPVPWLTKISPNSTLRGSGDTSLAVEGNKFIRSSSIYLSNIPLTATFTDNHHIQAVISKEMLLKAGTFPVTISNPAPEGGVSGGISFTVNNPVPSVVALEPAEATAGAEGVTVNILGSGFFEDTEVSMEGMKRPATFVNNTKLQIGLSAEDLKTPGKYEIMTHNLSPGGGSSNAFIFTVKNPLEVKVTSPGNGETINKGKVMVKGTFKSCSQDVGIAVNGVVADMKGNQWIANDVPLTQGENILKALIRDTSGNTAETSITVHTGYLSEAIRLSANITSGIAPLKTHFLVSTELFYPITNYQMDFEGDGIIDYTGETFESINYTYSTEGIFYPMVTITDSQGNIYSDTIAVTVLNNAEIDTLLKSKWEGMKGALAKGDIEGGLNYFCDPSKDVYRKAFNVIIDELPQIISQMQNVEMVYLMDHVAKHRINRVQDIDGISHTITYYIYFSRDDGGVWRIDYF